MFNNTTINWAISYTNPDGNSCWFVLISFWFHFSRHTKNVPKWIRPIPMQLAKLPPSVSCFPTGSVSGWVDLLSQQAKNYKFTGKQVSTFSSAWWASVRVSNSPTPLKSGPLQQSAVTWGILLYIQFSISLFVFSSFHRLRTDIINRWLLF